MSAPLHVLLDATASTAPGARRVLEGGWQALAGLPGVTWTLVCRPEQRPGLAAPAGAAVEVVPAPDATRWLAGRLAWSAQALPGLARSRRVDLVLLPHGVPPWRLPCPCVVGLPPPEPMPAADGVFSRRWWWQRQAADALARQGLPRAARVLVSARAALAGVDAAVAARARVVPPWLLPGWSAAPVPAREEGRLLCVGSVHVLRNHPVVLEALVLLREQERMSPRLIIAGAPADAEHARFLRRQVESLGLGRQVELLGGLEPAALREEYGRACAALVPGTPEGGGLVYREALAAGTPAVVADGALARELCGDGAEYVPAGSPVLLARALRDLLRDAPARNLLAQRGLAVAAHPAPAQAAQTLLDVLTEAAA